MPSDYDDLHEAAVRPHLTTAWLGRRYHYVPEIGSTNSELKAWVDAGTEEEPPAGTVLLTDYQSAGRGRLGRRWEAPPGSSLLFSVLFRPGWTAARAGWLTMLAGLAVAEAVAAIAGVTVGLKWPNDVMAWVDGGWRKLGGLLVDAQLADDRLTYAILGVGINVNIPAEALPAAVTPPTSLLLATGHPVPRRPLLLECLGRLEAHYDAAAGGRSPQADWNERLITLGREVTVSSGAGTALVGVAETTDEAGSLIVRDASGMRHTVAAGDVTLRDRGAGGEEANGR
jgi:BirA family biotin operon repressor/biotin-[acetyl-CoA-carboxylase] ligase